MPKYDKYIDMEPFHEEMRKDTYDDMTYALYEKLRVEYYNKERRKVIRKLKLERIESKN